MALVKKVFSLILSLSIALFLLGPSVFAQAEISEEPPKEETLEAVVEKIIEEKQIKPAGSEDLQLYQKLELLITKGSRKDQKIIVESGDLPLANLVKYRAGDRVIVNLSQDFEGKDYFYITDYIRRGPLLWLLIVFVILTVLVGKWQGLTSLLGMAISFLVIFKLILPQIDAGKDPVWVAILGSLIIIPITFLLSHGINQKTLVSITGTLISLTITGILACLFVPFARLTGFASEEAGFIQAYRPGVINFQGLLLAGIIIGVLGVMDDITVSQAAIVKQMKEANNKLKVKQLYQKAMSVGKDHIASMTNTLILVYTGASLPLLILFINNPRPFSEMVNYEIIAAEIVRTLIGSIGLILAVPITTIIAALVIKKTKII